MCETQATPPKPTKLQTTTLTGVASRKTHQRRPRKSSSPPRQRHEDNHRLGTLEKRSTARRRITIRPRQPSSRSPRMRLTPTKMKSPFLKSPSRPLRIDEPNCSQFCPIRRSTLHSHAHQPSSVYWMIGVCADGSIKRYRSDTLEYCGELCAGSAGGDASSGNNAAVPSGMPINEYATIAERNSPGRTILTMS